jgi:predicted DCC family thiol-disulfide oxidoreductase YuxK
MTQLEELDGWRRLSFVDLERESRPAKELVPGASIEAMREQMTVVTPDGRALRGFFAFRELSLRLPIFSLLVPVMVAPGAEWIGTRVYAWVARRRARRVCEGERCAVHGGGERVAGGRAAIDFGGSAS